MSKITGVVIAKNEEKMLAKCLDSLAFCDQVIVVDTGSTDATIEIATKKHANVYSIIEDDFSKIREFAASKVRTGWLVYVDADERVSKELAGEITKVVTKDDKGLGAYRVVRQNYYLGNHHWPQKERLERVFRKANLKGWRGVLHETAQVEGEIGELTGLLTHFTHRDLSEMVNKTNLWSEKEAKLRFDISHPPVVWWRFPRVMVQAWYRSYITERGWKAGTAGVVESLYQMFSIFITYAKLWELQQKKK